MVESNLESASKFIQYFVICEDALRDSLSVRDRIITIADELMEVCKDNCELQEKMSTLNQQRTIEINCQWLDQDLDLDRTTRQIDLKSNLDFLDL